MSEVRRRRCDVCGKESEPVPEWGVFPMLQGWTKILCYVQPYPTTDEQASNLTDQIEIHCEACSPACAVTLLERVVSAARSGEKLLVEDDEHRARRERRNAKAK